MPLFDDGTRTEMRVKLEMESSFDYLNKSARPAVEAFRERTEDWFQRFPRSGQIDLRARFRSPIEVQHQGAFFELYVHELVRRNGFGLEVHPEISGTRHHPDFLVSSDQNARFYLEATVAGVPSLDEQSAEARVAQVYDSLNSLDSPTFFLRVQVRGAPNSPPPTRGLRRELTAWLARLDPDEIGEFYRLQNYDDLPAYEWEHDGWMVTFTPIAKSVDARGREGIRPIGVIMPEARSLNTHGDLKEAIERKSKKYGNLDLPYVVAANLFAMHCDNVDVMNGLFGQETTVFTQLADGTYRAESGSREPNGVWFGRRGPRNTLVSAVLVVANLSPWSMSAVTPELFLNPWALNMLDASGWSLPQCIPDLSLGRVEHRPGDCAGDVLGLPNPWPISWD
jgi:hypothetical protein